MEHTGFKKKYLKTGDEIFADSSIAIIDSDGNMKFVSFRSDCEFWHDGIEVEFDEDQKPYISLPDPSYFPKKQYYKDKDVET
jgi:hypothetical protein